jgi:hypothetical protein
MPPSQTTLEQKETKATKNRSREISTSSQIGQGTIRIVKTTAGGPRPNGRLRIDDPLRFFRDLLFLTETDSLAYGCPPVCRFRGV